MLKKVKDSSGNLYVLHVEYQTDRYPEMAYRMAEYSIMLQRKHKLPVRQFVVYIGPGKANMDNTITTEDLQFRYNLTELSAVNYKLFLKSDKVEEKMLAILGNLASTSTESVLEQIVKEIETNSSVLEQGRYFRQLRVLLQLRSIHKKTIKDMALTGKIFKEEKDILYIRGQIKGEEVQLAKALEEKKEIARGLRNKNIDLKIIAEATGFTIQQIRNL